MSQITFRELPENLERQIRRPAVTRDRYSEHVPGVYILPFELFLFPVH